MQESSFGRIFARRSAVCYYLICIMFLVSALRLHTVASMPAVSAGNKSSAYRLTLARPRGYIYDCRGIALNNQNERIIAAVLPTGESVSALRSAFPDDDISDLLAKLEKGKPIVCELPRAVECEGIKCIAAYDSRSQNRLALHTVGYTDGTGHGSSGLELAFDELLYCEKTVDAVFEADAAGAVLGGRISIQNAETEPNSIVTTLDSKIQGIAERAAKFQAGAIAICEVNTGKLRAVLSRPDFNAADISQYLNDTSAPLINRALCGYSVGSVFKPCVAAAGIENGLGDFFYECMGASEIEGRRFHCHNREGHGGLELRGALSNSCNTYFYNFAARLSAKPILKTASALQFSAEFDIGGGMGSGAGNLPLVSDIKTVSELANLAIGQGELLLSPVAMLSLYSAIAAGGAYYLPYIVEEKIINGNSVLTDTPKKTEAMKKETAESIKDMLIEVVENGTGKAAKPRLVSAAGKTATAQTGQYSEDGKEKTIGWFCGFFPAQTPKYAVCIMIEDASGYNAAPVFAEIADNITAMENGQPLAVDNGQG